MIELRKLSDILLYITSSESSVSINKYGSFITRVIKHPQLFNNRLKDTLLL